MADEAELSAFENEGEAVQALRILLKYVVLHGLEELKSGQKETRRELEDGQKETRKELEELSDRVGKVETAVSVSEAKYSAKFAFLAALGSGALGIAATLLTTWATKKMGM